MELNSLDWSIAEKDTSQIEANNAKLYEENLHFLKAFSTPDGKKVMEWLTLHTLESPTWWPGQDKAFGYFREGQNSLVRQLKAKIKQAKEYKK